MASIKQSTVLSRVNFDTVIVYSAASITFLSIALLFIILTYFALPVLLQGGESSPFTWVWAPANQQFGIMPMLCSSLLVSFSAIALAFPLAVAIACWLIAIGRGMMLTVVRSLIYFMTAIPTVIYAFVALFLLTPIIRQAIGGTGLCWLTVTLMLTLLILPTMVLVIVAGLQARLNQLLPSGIALGFSRFELLWSFVLPHAKNTLLAACALGFGRAIGDTLLALMLAGNATQVPWHLSDSLRTLAAHMALVTANEVGGQAYSSLFAAGFLLLLINASLSLIARRMGEKTAMQSYFNKITAKKAKEPL